MNLNFNINRLLSYLIPLAFCLPLYAQNHTKDDTSLRPNPTSDVAGGMGQQGFHAPKYAVHPTGKTLPKGIFRADLPLAYSFASAGFDADGNQGNYGLTLKRWMTGVVLQYGVSNTVSVAIGLPIVVANQVTMNGSRFTYTEIYNRYYNKFVSQMAQTLSGGGLCGSVNSCTNFINNGGVLNGPATFTLPTGEIFTFNNTSSIQSQIQNVIIAASAPSDGATGIGDLQLGILWNVVSEESPIRHMPLYLSLGGGLRIPTGKFNLASALRSTGGDGTLITGGGTFDLIGRLNLDYVAVPGLIFSWQHQMEYSLNGVDLTRTSMIDPRNFNPADPNSCNNGSCGDGVGNTLRFSRNGFHQIGFLEGAWGLGNVYEKLKWLGVYSQAKYNIAAKAYLNSQPIVAIGDQFYLGESSMHPDMGVEQSYSAVGGLKFSGLPYKFPAELSAEFEYPFYALNRIVSPMNVMTTLSVYF